MRTTITDRWAGLEPHARLVITTGGALAALVGLLAGVSAAVSTDVRDFPGIVTIGAAMVGLG